MADLLVGEHRIGAASSLRLMQAYNLVLGAQSVARVAQAEAQRLIHAYMQELEAVKAAVDATGDFEVDFERHVLVPVRRNPEVTETALNESVNGKDGD